MSAAEPFLETLDSSGNGGEGVFFPTTLEGTVLADISLLLMALLTIFFGALRSVHFSKAKKCEEEENSGAKNGVNVPERITSQDAARFPIEGSCYLLGLYFLFNCTWSTDSQELLKSSTASAENNQSIGVQKLITKENIKLLLSVCVSALGVRALSRVFSSLIGLVFPASFLNKAYHLLFTQRSGKNTEEILNYEFDTKSVVSLVLSSVVGVWYLLQKHWIANNLLALALALNGLEQVHLNNVSTGCVLLGGLFVFDVFWVFGTNVMETVAMSFKAPIKLLFPLDLLEKGLGATYFTMLGLGDIVVPGFFIALLLRFDISLKKNTRTYFYSSLAGYTFGLVLTTFVMHTFNCSQPALLYLVPACVGVPVIMALIKGELKEMFRYEEASEEAGTDSEKKDL